MAGATTQRIFLLGLEGLRLFDARNSWLKWSAVALVLLVLSLNRLLQTQRWKKHEFYRQAILNRRLRAGFTIKKKKEETDAFRWLNAQRQYDVTTQERICPKNR
jgi:hypothetical protein